MAACAIACSAPASWQLSDRATAAPLLLDARQGGKQAEARQRPRRKQRSQCEREGKGEAGRGRNIFIFSSSDCDCAGFVVMLLGVYHTHLRLVIDPAICARKMRKQARVSRK